MKLDDKVMSAIPLLAPVPTAWMIGVATNKIMGFPWPVSIIAALTVEGLGFVSINTANEFLEFNRHLNGVELKQKLNAPVWQAYVVSGLYILTATLMTVVLHIAPSWVVYAPLPFIIMTAAGGWLFALRKEHAVRVVAWEKGREEAKAKRRSASVSDAPAKTSDAGSDAQRRSAKKSATLSVAPAKIYQCECGEKFVDRFKYSGHTRTCATRKEILASKDLTPVEIPTSKKAVK